MVSAPAGYVAVSGVEHDPDSKPQMVTSGPVDGSHVVGVVAVPHPVPPHNMVHRGWKFLAIAQFLIFALHVTCGPPPNGPHHGPHHGPGGEWFVEGNDGVMHHKTMMMPRRGMVGDVVAPDPTAAAACSAAAKAMKKSCGDSYAEIAAALDAGTITEAQAQEKYAAAREECKAQGKKVADACSGPWGPKPAAPNFFGKVFHAAAAGSSAAACTDAAKEMKKVCKDPFSAIAADLAAGKITEAEAKKAYAAAAEKCAEEGKKIADACGGPWGPEPAFGAAAPVSPACAAATAEVKKVCKDPFAAIAADLAAGKITAAEAEQEFAAAAEKCTAAGTKMADDCAKPKPPAPFGAADSPAAACTDAAKEMKKECGDRYAVIAADLAAGKITAAEAKKAYAAAAEKCAEEGKKIADACAGPWGPEPAFGAPAPVDPACAAAKAEVKTVCKDPFAAIAADLAAGKITAAEAEQEFTAAAEKCAAAGAKMADDCLKPKPPAPFGAAVSPAAEIFDVNKCAVEVANFKNVCQDAYSKIDDEVKAGKLTPAQASKKFAKVAAKCKAEAPKVAAACDAPKPPPTK